MAVITLGAGGAILRGRMRADAPGVRGPVLSTIGAGDTVTGTLLGRLAHGRLLPAGRGGIAARGGGRAAETCARWGALE